MKKITEQLFRIKDLGSILAESHDPSKRLKKALGAFDLVLLGIGVIIGAGISATVGTAAAGDGRQTAAAAPASAEVLRKLRRVVFILTTEDKG